MTKTDEKNAVDNSNELGKKFEPSVFQHQKKSLGKACLYLQITIWVAFVLCAS
jgi:hypothetical protein